MSDFASPAWNIDLIELRQAAQALGLQLQVLDVRAEADVAPAFRSAKTNAVGALLVASDAVVSQYVPLITQLAERDRLPLMGYQSGPGSPVDNGGLASYGPRTADLFRRAAYYVDRILRGTRPADLPVEGPTTFDLAINVKTAQALNITIPPDVAAQVTEWIT
jgi:putative ABC transport system substrate-binding protein